MILLPDEDQLPVGAQVNAVIGEALRQSVAGVEPSPGFEARLAAALDAAEQGDHAEQASTPSGERAAGSAVGQQAGETGSGAGRGSEAAEAAS
jgi:hypothetical protein